MPLTEETGIDHRIKIIIEQFADFDDAAFIKIFGKNSISKARKIKRGKYDFSITGFKNWLVDAKITCDEGTFTTTIDFSKAFKSNKCSCREGEIQGRHRKQCAHLCLMAETLKANPELLESVVTSESNEKKLTSEEITAIQKSAEERKKNIENLKLDQIIVNDALESVHTFICNLTHQGLQRCSPATLEVLNALEIKTKIAKLANIHKELIKLRELIIAYMDKAVAFDMSSYKYRLNQLTNFYQLCEQLLDGKQPNYNDITPLAIIGRFRSEYIPADDIKAQCLGMKGFHTDSGFTGCSGYYLDLSENKLISISQVLPSSYFGEDPVQIFTMPVKTIGFTPESLSHGFFKFTNVKLNDKGNISLHKGLGIFSTKIKALQSPEFASFKVVDWLKLLNRLYSKEATPIRLPYRLTNFLVLEPARWGRFEFDEINQVYTANLADLSGNTLVMRVKNEPFNHLTIQNLEKILGDEKLMPNALFGSVYVKEGSISVEPISLLYYQGVGIKPRSRRSTEPAVISEFHLSLEKANRLEPDF
ncbi:MAG: hypothetical protein ACTSRU_05690 [Candidatus Hodarchaeales archaeon]